MAKEKDEFPEGKPEGKPETRPAVPGQAPTGSVPPTQVSAIPNRHNIEVGKAYILRKKGTKHEISANGDSIRVIRNEDGSETQERIVGLARRLLAQRHPNPEWELVGEKPKTSKK